jgi:hypothetical protein
MDNVLLNKARNTFSLHSRGYRTSWGTPASHPGYTGDFGKDYNCSVPELVKSFEEDACPVCKLTYASMTEGKKGVARNANWHKSFHIWYPEWIVVCRVCHPKLEGGSILEKWVELDEKLAA